MQPIVFDAKVLEPWYAEYGADFEAMLSLSSDKVLMSEYVRPVRVWGLELRV